MRRIFLLLVLATIIMSGPLAAQNTPPIFNQSHDTITIREGDLIDWTISVYEANSEDSISMYVDPSLDDPVYKNYLIFEWVDDTTYSFRFNPLYDFVAEGETVVNLTIYATDQIDVTAMPISITVVDRNGPPIFAPLPDTSFQEGTGTLEIEIIATDPEGGRVTLFWQDSVANMTFNTDAYSQDTGLFSFTPALDQGGSYQIMFKAMDDDAEDPGVDSVTLYLQITELDQPPNLFVSPSGSQTVREGGRLRIKWRAYDDYEANLQVKIFPPPDSSVFKGDMTLIDYVGLGHVDSGYVDSGYLEFAPDYNFLETRNDTVIVLKFSVGDAYDTVRQERVITVYNVKPDNNDPGLPDTLTTVSAIWDDSIPGFKFRTRIWNDSAVAAGMTGFRWHYPWLYCDTIIFDAGNFNDSLGTSLYTKDYIYNDSMMFLTTFIFYDSLFLDSGYSEYFTAYFKYDPDLVDIDSIPYIKFDTSKVGSSGEFFLDKRLRGDPPLNISDEELLLSLKSSFTYKPMVQMGYIRAPGNRVRMEIFDVGKGVALGKGNILCARNEQYEPKQYEIRLLLENSKKLANMYFDFKVSNDNNGVIWSYQDPVISAVPISRMSPDVDIWSASSGIQLSAYSMDGLAADSFRVFGIADPGSGGLPPGLAEYMVRIPFTILDVTSEEATLCFDSTAIGAFGAWLFTDTSGQLTFPVFDGGLCLRVQYAPAIVTDRVNLEVYDMFTGTALGEDDSLYVRNAAYTPKQYELRLQLENKKQLSDISLDFTVYSDNQDVLWSYGDTLFKVDTLSRMYPDSVVWPASSGLQFAPYSMDGAAADSFRIAGTADTDSSGLPPGTMATVVKIPFVINDVIGEEGMLCFDSGAVETPAGWSYTDTSGLSTSPIFRGRKCFPVKFSPTISADRVNLVVYDVGDMVIVDEDSALYMRDDDDLPKQYELRFQMENRKKLQNLSLDFQIYAPAQDVAWAYHDTIMRVLSTSRMYPDDDVWPTSSGLQLFQYGLDGTGVDSLRFEGSADPEVAGLPYGSLQNMISMPFTIESVTGEMAMLCFDTGAVQIPGHWYFTDSAGLSSSPIFGGELCFPVYYSSVTAVGEDRSPLPLVYRLDQNYPNPFNPSTTILFTLARRDHVKLTVFNILGQVVITLADRTYDPGIHAVVWDGCDSGGQTAASGIYLYRIESAGLTKTRKMILLR